MTARPTEQGKTIVVEAASNLQEGRGSQANEDSRSVDNLLMETRHGGILVEMSKITRKDSRSHVKAPEEIQVEHNELSREVKEVTHEDVILEENHVTSTYLSSREAQSQDSLTSPTSHQEGEKLEK